MAGTWQCPWLEVLLEESVKLQGGWFVPGRFLIHSVLRARPLQKSCVTERCDTELGWIKANLHNAFVEWIRSENRIRHS